MSALNIHLFRSHSNSCLVSLFFGWIGKECCFFPSPSLPRHSSIIKIHQLIKQKNVGLFIGRWSIIHLFLSLSIYPPFRSETATKNQFVSISIVRQSQRRLNIKYQSWCKMAWSTSFNDLIGNLKDNVRCARKLHRRRNVLWMNWNKRTKKKIVQCDCDDNVDSLSLLTWFATLSFLPFL